MEQVQPILNEYLLTVANHSMRASVEHLELARRFSFYFDDKLVSEKALPAGDFLTDDDCIQELVDNYCKTQVGVYADVLKHHSDQVHLVSRTLKFTMKHFGISIDSSVVIQNQHYQIEMSVNNGQDTFSSSFQSESFSDVLEKFRFFTSIMENVNSNLSANIDQISNDKIEQWFKWKE